MPGAADPRESAKSAKIRVLLLSIGDQLHPKNALAYLRNGVLSIPKIVPLRLTYHLVAKIFTAMSVAMRGVGTRRLPPAATAVVVDSITPV